MKSFRLPLLDRLTRGAVLVLLALFVLSLCAAPALRAQDEGEGKDAGGQEPPEEGQEPPLPPPENPPDPAEKGIEFKTEKASADFSAAVEAFNAKDYKKASGLLKKLKPLGKADADKAALDRWLNACDGGVLVQRCSAEAERGGAQLAFFQAVEQAPRYRGTPIAREFDAFVGEVAPRVVFPLEDFEVPSANFSAKYGKKQVSDAAKSFHGRGFLAWSQTQDQNGFQLKFRNTPRTLARFSGVVFWMRSSAPADLTVLALSPSKPKAVPPNSHRVSLKPSAGEQWVRYHLEFNKFQKEAAGDFGNIESLSLLAPKTSNFKMDIDYVCLVLKEPKAAAGAAPGKAGDPKKPGAKNP